MKTEIDGLQIKIQAKSKKQAADILKLLATFEDSNYYDFMLMAFKLIIS